MSRLIFFCSVLAVLLVPALILGCSSSNEKPIHEGSQRTLPLEIPPGLTVPTDKNPLNTVIASHEVTFSAYANTSSEFSGQFLKPNTRGIRLVQDGAIRWLEIDAKPEGIWWQLGEFWSRAGFELALNDPKLGIVETRWKESNKDSEASWLATLLNTQATTTDKYRVRLERDEKSGKALMFLTHRGQINEGGLYSDPQLEAEMLQRFLVFIGVGDKQAKGLTSIAQVDKRAELDDQQGNVILKVKENFPRTWRRTGLALDRMGLTIDDRNRSSGIYYIQLPSNFVEGKEIQTNKYLVVISLNDTDGVTQVSARAREGSTGEPFAVRSILEKLQTHLQ